MGKYEEQMSEECRRTSLVIVANLGHNSQSN